MLKVALRIIIVIIYIYIFITVQWGKIAPMAANRAAQHLRASRELFTFVDAHKKNCQVGT